MVRTSGFLVLSLAASLASDHVIGQGLTHTDGTFGNNGLGLYTMHSTGGFFVAFEDDDGTLWAVGSGSMDGGTAGRAAMRMDGETGALQPYGHLGTAWVQGFFNGVDGDVDSLGRILMAGSDVRRCTAAGWPDTSFATYGYFFQSIGGAGALYTSAHVMDDQRILLVGYVQSAGQPFLLTRLLENGALDPSFGAGGNVLLAGQPRGYRVLRANATGCLVSTGGTSGRVLAFDADGALDPSFGNGGVLVASQFVPSFAPHADGIVLCSNGDIAMAADNEIKRFMANGSGLVPGFAPNVPNAFRPGGLMRQLPDSGFVTLRGAGELWKFDAAGSVDTSFGLNGTLYVTALGDIVSLGRSTQDGIVLVGSVANQGSYQGEALLARMDFSGSLDPSFGVNGVAKYPLGNSADWVGHAAMDRVGRLVFSTDGYHDPFGGGLVSPSVLARTTTNGWIDTSFAENGTVRDHGLKLFDMIIDTDSSIIVGTEWPEMFGSAIKVFRYDADGVNVDPQPTPGTGFANTNYEFNHPHDMALLPDGRIVVVGRTNPYNFSAGEDMGGIMVLLPDRTNDPGFASNSTWLTMDTADCSMDLCAIDPSGNILGLGGCPYAGDFSNDLMFVKLDGTGAPVPGFGQNGVLWTEVEGVENIGNVTDLMMRPDGRAVLSCTIVDTAGVGGLGLIQFEASSGNVDTTFGIGGFTFRAEEPYSAYGLAKRAVLLPDGSIVRADVLQNEGTVSFKKWLVDGTPDASFGSGGQLEVGDSTMYAFESVLLASDATGAIMVTGSLKRKNLPTALTGDVFAFRLLPDGLMDVSVTVPPMQQPILIFPNPVIDRLMFRLHGWGMGRIGYSVLDIRGRPVAVGTLVVSSPGPVAVNVPLQGQLAPGQYVLRVEEKDRMASQVFLVGH